MVPGPDLCRTLVSGYCTNLFVLTQVLVLDSGLRRRERKYGPNLNNCQCNLVQAPLCKLSNITGKRYISASKNTPSRAGRGPCNMFSANCSACLLRGQARMVLPLTRVAGATGPTTGHLPQPICLGGWHSGSRPPTYTSCGPSDSTVRATVLLDAYALSCDLALNSSHTGDFTSVKPGCVMGSKCKCHCSSCHSVIAGEDTKGQRKTQAAEAQPSIPNSRGGLLPVPCSLLSSFVCSILAPDSGGLGVKLLALCPTLRRGGLCPSSRTKRGLSEGWHVPGAMGLARSLLSLSWSLPGWPPPLGLSLCD